MKNKFDNQHDKDFAWKVRWRMKYDRNPLFPILSDKYKVKEYAKQLGIKTAKLLYVTNNPEDIPFDKLPNNYFIKANHASQWNIACIDSKLFMFEYGADIIDNNGNLLPSKVTNKRKLTIEKTISLCKKWLKTDYSPEEWGYQPIERKIIIEEKLESSDLKDLKDYRLFTFNGEVKAISVDSPSHRRYSEAIFLDTSWQEFKLTKYKENLPKLKPRKPNTLKEMLSIAKKIGNEFDFLRIDLFNTTKGVYLSEITLYPETGDINTPTSCPIFNKWLGSHWK